MFPLTVSSCWEVDACLAGGFGWGSFADVLSVSIISEDISDDEVEDIELYAMIYLLSMMVFILIVCAGGDAILIIF